MATPINHFSDRTDLGGNAWRTTIHAYPRYRLAAGGALTEAVARFRQQGARWVADEMVHRLEVQTALPLNGQVTLNHPYEADAGMGNPKAHQQVWRYTGVGRMDSAHQFVPLASMPVTTAAPVLFAPNRLRWTDYFPGVDLDLIISEDFAKTVLTIKPQGRALLAAHEAPNTLLAFRIQTDRGALNHAFTTPAGLVLNVDTATGAVTRGPVCMRSDGRVKATIPRGWLRHATDSPANRIRVERDLLIRQGEMFEVVPFDFLSTAPAGALLLNLTVSYQEGVSGYSGMTDVSLNSVVPDENQDGNNLYSWNDGGTQARGLMAWAVPSLGTITGVQFDFNTEASYNPNTGKMRIREMKRAFVETEADWEVYSTGNAWTTEGAESEGNDHGATEFNSAGAWSPPETGLDSFTLNASGVTYVHGVQGGTARFFLGPLADPDPIGAAYSDSEREVAADRPIMRITHETAVAPQAGAVVWVLSDGTTHKYHNPDGTMEGGGMTDPSLVNALGATHYYHKSDGTMDGGGAAAGALPFEDDGTHNYLNPDGELT